MAESTVVGIVVRSLGFHGIHSGRIQKTGAAGAAPARALKQKAQKLSRVLVKLEELQLAKVFFHVLPRSLA